MLDRFFTLLTSDASPASGYQVKFLYTILCIVMPILLALLISGILSLFGRLFDHSTPGGEQ